MEINLSSLNYKFISKPLLIGGKAKEYYDIRKTGDDFDFVVTTHDYENLAKLYPNNLKDLYGDLGVCVDNLEVWKSIFLFDYEFLSPGAVDTEDYKIISLEKLLFLTALGIKSKVTSHREKFQKDLELIVQKISDMQYKK